MGDLGGGKQIGAIWDRQMARGEAARAESRKGAFLRTRMAPAVSHVRASDPGAGGVKRGYRPVGWGILRKMGRAK